MIVYSTVLLEPQNRRTARDRRRKREFTGKRSALFVCGEPGGITQHFSAPLTQKHAEAGNRVNRVLRFARNICAVPRARWRVSAALGPLATRSKLDVTSMARVEPEQLRDPELIFIGRTLRLALRAEEWLTTAGIDYGVQIESVGRSFLFRTERMGAVIYVTAGQAVYCRQHLTAAGLGSGVVESEDPDSR
jgi:hypothetical protein